MHSMLRRISALFLAGLLMLSAGGLSSYALRPGEPNPICRLGTTPRSMLAGGGKSVETERGVYYLDADGSVCCFPAQDVLVAGPVARLNYEDGVLYYARTGAGMDFELCAFELDTGRERTLLEHFPGQPGQVYLVDGQYLDFSVGDEIWQLELSTGVCSLLRTVEHLWSYVPTGCGLIWASGSLFDYSLMAEGHVLAEHVDDYFVDFALENGMLVYTLHGKDFQLPLFAAFAGRTRPADFAGYEPPVFDAAESSEQSPEEPTTEGGAELEVPAREAVEHQDRPENQLRSSETETERFLADSSVELVPVDPNDPQSPMRLPQTEDAEEKDRNAPTADEIYSRAENSEATCDPCTADLVSVLPHDDGLRREASEGVMNIVRRARQMLSIQWTPQKSFGSWGNALDYQPGVTYTGLPYCQGCSYVPWDTGLEGFLEAVSNPDSKLYTDRTNFGRSGPFYGTDCSGFATWAWDSGARGTTWSMLADSRSVYIGKDYLSLQLGDVLLSNSHVMLVTDVTYSTDGSIATVEISHSSNTHSCSDCCNSMRFTGTDGLLQIKQSYLNQGYGIYRSANRDQVRYSHSCAVPLEGDVCSKCGIGLPSDPNPVADEFFKTGIDVSRWQGEIDWQKVSTQIDFAIVRIGYTGNMNPTSVMDDRFDANADGCEANGIPYGVYYYAGATSPEQAVEEANAVLEYLGQRVQKDALRLPVFYDVEEQKNILQCSDAELLEITTAFCTTIEKAGLRSGIYTSASVWDINLRDDAYKTRARWVAHWTPSGTDVRDGATLWQHAVKEGIDGINGLVDWDYWFGSFDNTEHRYVTQKTAASCTEDGVFFASCVHCEQQHEQRTPSFGGHIYSDFVCARCGNLQHAWDRFSDVREGAWYSDAVDYVMHAELFNGLSDTVFGGEEAMTRCMLVTVLHRMAGSPGAQADNPFTDLRENAYYVPSVLWGAQNGIVCGTGNGQFSPELKATREQIVTFLHRYLLKLDPTNQERGALSAFADSGKVSNFAKESMAWAVGVGIIKGKMIGMQQCLAPTSPATRAEVAVMLERFATYLKKMP